MWCAMNSMDDRCSRRRFGTRKRISFTFLGSNQFVWRIFLWVATQWLFTTVSMANPVRGCFCWALPRLLFCFVSLLDGEAHFWLGDLRFAFCVFLFVVVCDVDLPSYMTTGVNVDVILNCFFTCKDRASERDRPYRRKKKQFLVKEHLATLQQRWCLEKNIWAESAQTVRGCSFFSLQTCIFLPHSFFYLKHAFFHLMCFFRIVAGFFTSSVFQVTRKMCRS